MQIQGIRNNCDDNHTVIFSIRQSVLHLCGVGCKELRSGKCFVVAIVKVLPLLVQCLNWCSRSMSNRGLWLVIGIVKNFDLPFPLDSLNCCPLHSLNCCSLHSLNCYPLHSLNCCPLPLSNPCLPFHSLQRCLLIENLLFPLHSPKQCLKYCTGRIILDLKDVIVVLCHTLPHFVYFHPRSLECTLLPTSY